MDIDQLEQSIRDDVNAADNQDALETIRIKYLGRKGAVTAMLHSIGEAPPEQRPRIGAESNRLKQLCEGLLSTRRAELAGTGNEFYQPPIDGTLPARDGSVGHRHVIAQTFRDIKEILYGMGYSLAEGPEVELEYYNFEALNFPEEHPSRDLQDTFYITEDILLRTHTSPVQIRFMESNKPPLKVFAPGRVYRNEAIDHSHAAEFHQVEGLYVDANVSLADLRKDVSIFVQELFGAKTKIRFKPHFFPFTEPSVDVDMTCFGCKGKGCNICGQTGWIEIMGGGRVHPNVFRGVGYDPERVSGFAFGLGVDRVAMIKYGIGDIRLFLGNDMRFLSQF